MRFLFSFFVVLVFSSKNKLSSKAHQHAAAVILHPHNCCCLLTARPPNRFKVSPEALRLEERSPVGMRCVSGRQLVYRQPSDVCFALSVVSCDHGQTGSRITRLEHAFFEVALDGLPDFAKPKRLFGNRISSKDRQKRSLRQSRALRWIGRHNTGHKQIAELQFRDGAAS